MITKIFIEDCFDSDLLLLDFIVLPIIIIVDIIFILFQPIYYIVYKKKYKEGEENE